MLIIFLILFFSTVIFAQEYAIQFDGVNDYVDFGNNNNLDINTSNSNGLTIEFWIKLNSLNDSCIFHRYIWGTGGYIVKIEDNGILYFQWASPENYEIGNTSTKLTTGVWTHVACQINKTTGTGRIYINGVLKVNQTGVSMPASLNYVCQLGYDSWHPEGQWRLNGIIDELRVSNVARYSSDFTPPSTPFSNDSNTVALWHFNEGTGTTTADATGKGITGTLTNGPAWVSGYYGSGGPNNPPNPPYDLKCSGQVNPTNVTDFTPDLSWTFSDPDPGNYQSAFQVIVADNLTSINNNQGNKWDTSKVSQSASYVTYGGSSLSYGATYYWKVRTWDNNNTQGNYSNYAYFIMTRTPPSTTGYFAHPYSVNSWQWPLSGCQEFKNAHIDRYRVMCYWRDMEPHDNSYSWGSLDNALDSANSLGAKLSLVVYSSPDWARADDAIRLSYPPEKYAEFITALLQHCEARRPNVVEAVEICNECPTGEEGWIQSRPPVYGTEQRDPSLYYANILKAGYNAVKSYKSNLLVVMDGIWLAAYHHLDELYQLGCKNYFERINFHYYLSEGSSLDEGRPQDPADVTTVWHFPTNLYYLKYLAEENNDPSKLIWLTEFGWRISDEQKKSDYMRYVLDICRRSGYVDLASMYVGLAGGYPYSHDKIGLIYTDNDWAPSYFIRTIAYNMYVDYGNQYPTWDPSMKETLEILPVANKPVAIKNPGFELGNTTGWIGATLDSAVKHSGNYSGRATVPNGIRTEFYNVEQGKLYEVIAWIKVSASGPTTCMITPVVNEVTRMWNPPNYFGIVDTRNYPGTWRRLRFMYRAPVGQEKISIEFMSSGTGTFWIDDIQIKPLKPGSEPAPALLVIPSILDFGEVDVNEEVTMSFDILNCGNGGTLTGTITADKAWIEVYPQTWTGNNVTVNVTIYGNYFIHKLSYKGNITISSNGGTEIIPLEVQATCVLTKPNPYRPQNGELVFFGNGIIPYKTTIKIWTLSGELVKKLESKDDLNIIKWDGKDEYGKNVADGIYIYTYESPSEKGTGKFTLINKGDDKIK